MNLSWNTIRGMGGIKLGRAMKANTKLRTLDLAWNGLANEGAMAFGDSLQVWPTDPTNHSCAGLRYARSLRRARGDHAADRVRRPTPR